MSPIAEKRAENDGRTQPTPEDLAVASIAALGISQAERFGAKGVFGQNAGNVAQRVVGAGIRESGTEAIQNPMQYAVETAGTEKGFDFLEAADQAAAGAVGGLVLVLVSELQSLLQLAVLQLLTTWKQLVILPDA